MPFYLTDANPTNPRYWTTPSAFNKTKSTKYNLEHGDGHNFSGNLTQIVFQLINKEYYNIEITCSNSEQANSIYSILQGKYWQDTTFKDAVVNTRIQLAFITNIFTLWEALETVETLPFDLKNEATQQIAKISYFAHYEQLILQRINQNFTRQGIRQNAFNDLLTLAAQTKMPYLFELIAEQCHQRHFYPQALKAAETGLELLLADPISKLHTLNTCITQLHLYSALSILQSEKSTYSDSERSLKALQHLLACDSENRASELKKFLHVRVETKRDDEVKSLVETTETTPEQEKFEIQEEATMLRNQVFASLAGLGVTPNHQALHIHAQGTQNGYLNTLICLAEKMKNLQNSLEQQQLIIKSDENKEKIEKQLSEQKALIEALTSQLTKLQVIESKLRDEYQRSEQERQKSQATNVTLTAELSDANTKSSELKTRLEEQMASSTITQKKLETENFGLEQEKGTLEKRVEDLTKLVSGLEQEKVTLGNQVFELDQKNAILMKLSEKMFNQPPSVRREPIEQKDPLVFSAATNRQFKESLPNTRRRYSHS